MGNNCLQFTSRDPEVGERYSPDMGSVVDYNPDSPVPEANAKGRPCPSTSPDSSLESASLGSARGAESLVMKGRNSTYARGWG